MRARGSALLVTMIVLSVLTLVAVASLQLAQGDSVTVNRQLNYRTLVQCAEAANRQLWAEYAGRVSSIQPYMVEGTKNPNTNDGGITFAPGHYDSDSAGPNVTITFDENVIKQLGSAAMGGGMKDTDTSNTFRGGMLGTPMMLTAHCRDGADRQYEIEMAVRFGL